MNVLDGAHMDKATGMMVHAIGSDKFPAPQGTLMATLIKGLLAHNLDWQFVLVGVFFAVTMELCGVRALAFAVGAYLPLSTTLPIWVGGVIKGVVDKRKGNAADSELGNGSLFSTGLVAGGALAGVLVAILSVNESVAKGRSLKDAFDFARLATDAKFKTFAIYEHCLPFSVVRAYDEARGIEWPVIWTVERDHEMWAALQG
jgi:hypothetical protein